MGLDMYAYKVKADLIGDQQVDIRASELALEMLGFEIASDSEFTKMNPEQRQQYWTRREEAEKRAKEEGLFDHDFAYWRKFNHLHGWMEKLYREKGGVAASFNCVTVRLMPEDIDRLESMARLKALAPTEGFFFGGTEVFDDDDRETVLTFVAQAREAFAGGFAVLYDSWW